MLSADLTHLPTRPGDWQRVLEAIYNADPTDERDELEWKSVLDLNSKSGQFHIARFVLAVANRAPNSSAVFDGHAVMIVGLAPGDAEGITPVDAADLVPQIRRYVGAVVGFELHYLAYRDADVLAVTVSPPRDGDPLFPVRREFDGAPQGTIFQRRDTKSDRANAAGIDALSQRAATTSRNVELEVELRLSSPLKGVTWTSDLAQRWADRERELLRDAREKAVEKEERELIPGREIRSFPATFRSELTEDRTPQQYEDEVEAYVEKILAEFDGAARKYLAHRGPFATFTLTNPTSRNLEDVAVDVYVPGDIEAYRRPLGRGSELRFLLPDRPRPWGPRPYPQVSQYRPHQYAPGPPPAVTIRNGGSVELIIHIEHLRPDTSYTPHSDWESGLIIAGEAPPLLKATWSATARNHDGVVTGELTVPTQAGVRDVTDELWAILRK